MKAGVFKLNMHPREYFDRNPFHEQGKGGKNRVGSGERSKSASSDKRPFKYSSPGKTVRSKFFFNNKIPFFFASLFSLVVIKMVVSINFPKVVKKILMWLVQCINQLKMK
jgi:hypothetical protein